jgi:hypothetical protein
MHHAIVFSHELLHLEGEERMATSEPSSDCLIQPTEPTLALHMMIVEERRAAIEQRIRTANY